jgi:hypothetical protein
MPTKLDRRDFLKLAGLALGGLAFNPFEPRQEEYDYGSLARVTVHEIDLYGLPRFDSQIVGKRYRDQLVQTYYLLTPESGPAYNPYWHRVWGGYLHNTHLQPVEIRFNKPLSQIPEAGQLCEVTVPYTQSFRYTRYEGWRIEYRLYYETTHWITSIDEGPDGEAWYRIVDELGDTDYHVPATHMRPIPDEELIPISPEISPLDKRIDINLATQTLTAFERDQQVFQVKVSSGVPRSKEPENGISTATPQGRFNVYSKMPSKHMGDGNLMQGDLDLDAYELVGVPWTIFFHELSTGYAIHGTYWHNNFGWPMSHGCVNLRNADAKWLFRWTTPQNASPLEVEVTGFGTQVHVYT